MENMCWRYALSFKERTSCKRILDHVHVNANGEHPKLLALCEQTPLEFTSLHFTKPVGGQQLTSKPAKWLNYKLTRDQNHKLGAIHWTTLLRYMHVSPQLLPYRTAGCTQV